jgi:hypothetical protein
MNKQQATKKADKLFSERIREEAICWAKYETPPACNGNIQCCHVMSRRYRAIRWSEDNAVAMCAAHHLYYTLHPLEWEDLCRQSSFVDWDALRRRALDDPPMDPFDVIASLSP